MVGCMLAAGQFYPRTCAPEDVRAAQEADRDNYSLLTYRCAALTRVG